MKKIKHVIQKNNSRWFGMKLQYTTECALRMMVYLTGESRIVSSREFEDKIDFSQQCIFSAGRKLKKAGYVNTVSGQFGGYVLGKSPEEITIQQILTAFKDELSLGCDNTSPDAAATMQNFEKFLLGLEEDVAQKMSMVTLSDLLKAT